MANEILRLPAYPSTQTRRALPASQRATLYQTIASTLAIVLALPPQKRDVPSTREFLATYAQDTAFQTLQTLIDESADEESGVGPTSKSTDERLIAKRALLFAEKLAQTSPGLDLQLLLDLSIIYNRTRPSHLHSTFTLTFQFNASLVQSISNDLVPGFTALISGQSPACQGLYAHRKVTYCILSFLRGAQKTPELLVPFTQNKQFITALANLYDGGMMAIASSYGGVPALNAGISAQERSADDWEKIWVETKVSLLDAFHIILTALLNNLAECPPDTPQLAIEAERTFDIIFALLELPSSSSSSAASGGSTPFLDQSLLADYQQSYDLSTTLARALRNAQEKDARLDLLESALRSFDSSDSNDNEDGHTKRKKPGALKILLRSSGIQPGIDNLGTRNSHAQPTQRSNTPNQPQLSAKDKGKSRVQPAPPPPSHVDPDLDIKATQVLDILPDLSMGYVKLLLAHDRYGRDPEKVVEALLEGTAMSEEELNADLSNAVVDAGGEYGYDYAHHEHAVPPKQTYDISQRQNIFDSETLDPTQLHVGKRMTTGDEVLRDRTFIEEMKRDIIRRAEAISDGEDEEVDEADIFGTGASVTTTSTANKGKGKDKAKADVGPEDDDDVVALRVAGDGEESGDDDEDDDEEEEDGEEQEEVQTPETVLELAYLRDPKLFDRDAATRRSKARIELRKQTGWDDSQIEGWKIMLERSPTAKEKLAEKHAFRGNEKGLDVRPGGGGGGSGGGRGRGRGAGRGGGRGRGGGGSGGRGGRGGAGGGAGGGATGESSARERAWKDKNKASRGNHNRKRGHDKKMARAGAVAGPSS